MNQIFPLKGIETDQAATSPTSVQYKHESNIPLEGDWNINLSHHRFFVFGKHESNIPLEGDWNYLLPCGLLLAFMHESNIPLEGDWNIELSD